jgi:hypothetical protein
MLLAASLLLGAYAQCGLPASIDPDGICNVDDNGYSNIDMSAISDAAISVTISTKGDYTDHAGVFHGATQGTLTDRTGTDGRYILACPQTAGQKTVKITLSRPAAYGGHIINGTDAFLAEWVQLFPKDSWTKVAEAFEPYTHNVHGSVIPLQEFRATTSEQNAQDAPIYDLFHVYMEVSGEGDFELKFGNPFLTYNAGNGDNWIAFEFKRSLLRVGSPWAQCSGSTAGTADYTGVGSIIPAYFGHPYNNRESYELLISELAGVTVPVKVILQMFGPDIEIWTKGAEDADGNPTVTCYPAGTLCPTASPLPSACKADNCIYNRWVTLISDIKAAAADVTILGFVETKEALESCKATSIVCPTRSDAAIEADIASYKDVGTAFPASAFDGFYFNQVGGSAAALADVTAIAEAQSGFTVMGLGEPLFDTTKLDKADVWVTLSVGDADIGVWTPYSWYPSASPFKWSSMVHGVPFGRIAPTAAALLDRGYGYIYLSTAEDFGSYPTNGTTPPMKKLYESLGSPGTRKRALRRLSEDDEYYFWGCDDTLFKCTPVCLEQIGVVTAIAADSKCTGAPIDQCACECYYSVAWSCRDGAVVCVATKGVEQMVVGDLVCSSRGTAKPSACEETPVAYGDYPVNDCIIQWQAEADAVAAEQALAEAAETSARPTTPSTTAQPGPVCEYLINTCNETETAAGGSPDGSGGLVPCSMKSCDDLAEEMGCGAAQRAIGPAVSLVCQNCVCGLDYVMTTTAEPTAEPTPLPTTTLAPSPAPTAAPTEEAPTAKPIVFNDQSSGSMAAAALGLWLLSRAA